MTTKAQNTLFIVIGVLVLLGFMYSGAERQGTDSEDVAALFRILIPGAIFVGFPTIIVLVIWFFVKAVDAGATVFKSEDKRKDELEDYDGYDEDDEYAPPKKKRTPVKRKAKP